MVIVFLAGLLAFIASCVWWGLSRRDAIGASASGSNATLGGGVGAVLILLGAMQMIAGAVLFFYIIAILFAAAAYLGVGPLAVPSLLFAGWGIVLGLRLAVRRTRLACRSASFWYFPIALFFVVGCVFEYRHKNEQTVQLLLVAIALFLVFFVMVVPLLPGAPRRLAKTSTRLT